MSEPSHCEKMELNDEKFMVDFQVNNGERGQHMNSASKNNKRKTAISIVNGCF